ncbi:peroxisome proliferator-activated receptor gamma coactivator-related protein 1 [Tachysurus vachellii]|uniref:peroxisome proliferator-activated receptor gamma coactivator-related protein 1 n=1 Tax=Tachysurus vachellii TaxID=175792 RepID=UPI00296B000E|nr:peroxisome proliferator-activated receptor gamma coactivator-related protein 1 [Tachysurus vachellii]
MAARWGTGEEMLTASKLEYFSSTTLDESEILQEGLCSLQYDGLDTGDALEALHGCFDPSILSIFEDSTNGEVKSGVDEESEATLLTALTEILDNVDDEKLSPFDTLPDMELLQGQKKFYEHLARHDGGEDGSAGFSELIQDLAVSSELDWCLPISLEQDGETVSVTLSDLVKHMHPYAMTLCVEGKEQLLPEGGIILEVMDKGEYGEPILAIPDLSFPLSVDSLADEQSVPEKVMSKHDDTQSEVAPSKVLPVCDDKVENVKIKHSQKESPEKRLSKKKWKTEDTKPVEGRVLRSMSSKEAVEEPSKEGEEQKRKKKVTFAPVLTVDENKKHQVKSEVKTIEVQEPKEIPSPTITATANLELNQVCTDGMKSQHLHIPVEKASPSDKCRETALPLDQQPEVSQSSEPKQKSLSLEQYRRLRQKKKPSPLEKVCDNSTKWPTLPEAPKELPPIPCLPEPNSKDPRRAASTAVKKECVPEVMPAWQPRGPGAPPTPQALLVPPASMLAASKKPESCKSISPAPTKPDTNLATPTSSSTQSCSLKPPVPTHMSENTITNKESWTAKETSAEIAPSLPMATIVGDTHNLHAAEQAKCLQNTPSASYKATVSQLSALSKDQEISQTQVVPEILITTKPDASNASGPKPAKLAQSVSTTKPTASSQRHVAPIALQPFSSAPIQARIMKLAEQMRMASAAASKTRSPTTELIQSFTSEIGIEASDLTSLLERFEETQTKEEQNVPEVCGRAAAVGNSSVEKHKETTVLKKACSPDLGSTAGLTPPATPPHQMWKPLAPVALLGKQSKSEIARSTPSKAIQIEPLPLHACKLQSKPQTSVTLGQIQPFSLDHDYCLHPKEPPQNELGNVCSSKQQPSIIKSTELPSANSKASAETSSKLPSTTTTKESFQENVQSQPLVCVSQSERKALTTTGIVTPDASPERLDSERFKGYSDRSPSPCHQKRGRTKRKYRSRLPSRSRSTSSSSGSSVSCSPPRKRYRSRSTSRSPSRYRTHSRSSSPRQRRYSYSSSDSWSRSRSRSRSHSRSRSPSHRSHHWDTRCSPNQRTNYCYDLKHHNEEIRRRKEKAIEERRVVYVGRIHGSMTRKELRERFTYFGEIEECTVHFREHGDNYGFVTYYNKKDAFNAIENGSKLRQPNELPFDLCFGGRRQFCRTGYADLDSNRDPVPAKARLNALDFDTLLKQAQRNLKR